MNAAIELVHKFNEQAGLLEHGYSDARESAYPIEEMLEGFNLGVLANSLRTNAEMLPDNSPREVSLEIIDQALSGQHDTPLPRVDRLDKHVDAIIYNIGSILKLGLVPAEVQQAILIVASANMQKLTAGKDANGKQLKPEGFIPPEVELQKLLDRSAAA